MKCGMHSQEALDSARAGFHRLVPSEYLTRVGYYRDGCPTLMRSDGPGFCGVRVSLRIPGGPCYFVRQGIEFEVPRLDSR